MQKKQPKGSSKAKRLVQYRLIREEFVNGYFGVDSRVGRLAELLRISENEPLGGYFQVADRMLRILLAGPADFQEADNLMMRVIEYAQNHDHDAQLFRYQSMAVACHLLASKARCRSNAAKNKRLIGSDFKKVPPEAVFLSVMSMDQATKELASLHKKLKAPLDVYQLPWILLIKYGCAALSNICHADFNGEQAHIQYEQLYRYVNFDNMLAQDEVKNHPHFPLVRCELGLANCHLTVLHEKTALEKFKQFNLFLLQSTAVSPDALILYCYDDYLSKTILDFYYQWTLQPVANDQIKLLYSVVNHLREAFVNHKTGLSIGLVRFYYNAFIEPSRETMSEVYSESLQLMQDLGLPDQVWGGFDVCLRAYITGNNTKLLSQRNPSMDQPNKVQDLWRFMLSFENVSDQTIITCGMDYLAMLLAMKKYHKADNILQSLLSRASEASLPLLSKIKAEIKKGKDRESFSSTRAFSPMWSPVRDNDQSESGVTTDDHNVTIIDSDADTFSPTEYSKMSSSK